MITSRPKLLLYPSPDYQMIFWCFHFTKGTKRPICLLMEGVLLSKPNWGMGCYLCCLLLLTQNGNGIAAISVFE
uniref:Uncharacterized protein n=1 Tax=Picea glauca TaxID=3330 RepID=A0A101LX26_PICGL|nr:hypothetical protein ABT39_MTgene6370 [Picea glauca]QHR86308.1 hypothetical protein Q903MT_gene307 [Picea sitchensis]